ncbi:hypothetical protein GCM10027596_27490 [Nocardioides korecus]
MSEPDEATEKDHDEAGSSGDGEREGSILDDGGIDTDERAGRSQGIDVDSEPDDDVKQEMEEEREKRLDPDNRPENAEIDNTDRDFDVKRGMFTDNEAYDEGEPEAYPGEDDPEGGADDGGDDSEDEPDDGSEPDDAPEDVQDSEQEEQRS